jgi:hypothetical protein
MIQEQPLDSSQTPPLPLVTHGGYTAIAQRLAHHRYEQCCGTESFGRAGAATRRGSGTAPTTLSFYATYRTVHKLS